MYVLSTYKLVLAHIWVGGSGFEKTCVAFLIWQNIQQQQHLTCECVCVYVCMPTTFLPFSEIKCGSFLSITFGNVTLLYDGSYSGFLNCTNGHESMVMIVWPDALFFS